MALSEFLRKLVLQKTGVNRVGLLLILSFLLYFFPPDLLSKGAFATGGDMHFWTFFSLVKFGLPHHAVRFWNPGNLCGEPLLVHYFPLAFFVMAFFSWFLPLGTAFNVGTLFPIILLPVSVYWSLRGLGWRFPAPLIGATFSLFFLCNQAYSMWGGNALSILAGEFAHAYALCFLLLAVGALGSEIRNDRFPFVSSILFACVAFGHGYVELSVPVFLLSIGLFFPFGNRKSRLTKCLLSGLFSILLSAWFIIPLIMNHPWTTPFPIQWKFASVMAEVFPRIFYPMFAVLLLGPLTLKFLSSDKNEGSFFRGSIGIWLLPTLQYILLYFIFPAFGLVDVRAFPQIYLFLCILSALLISEILRRMHEKVILVGTLPLVVLLIWWANFNAPDIHSWIAWNFSSWETKPLYRDLMNLTRALKGNLSDPRVIYEHNPVTFGTGTVRTFELLPYFSHRATLESDYIMPSILAPMVYDLQAEISKTPSCPLRDYDCPHYNLSEAIPRLLLLGVGDLVLITTEMVGPAKKDPRLQAMGIFGPWHLFRVKEQPSLAEVFKKKPMLVSNKDWRWTFYRWFRRYNGKQPMLVANFPKDMKIENNLQNCSPTVKVRFNELVLTTPCPGRPHFLKFSYHPTWKADTGDPLFLVSPGFIGLIPSKPVVHLRFGESWLWKSGEYVSALSLLFLVFLSVRTNRRFSSSKKDVGREMEHEIPAR